MVELGRVFDPDERKYIKVVVGGVPSKWHAYYNCTKHTIHLNSRESYGSDDFYMDTCLHEALHAAFPDLSEEAITKRTPIIKRLIKIMGIRPIDVSG